MEITKEEFMDYEAVRTSGVTNMYAVGVVEEISGLDRETQREIRDNYKKLADKYLKTESN